MIHRRHFGNIKLSHITQEFTHSADYLSLTNSAQVLSQYMDSHTADAFVTVSRGEGEKPVKRARISIRPEMVAGRRRARREQTAL